MRKARCARSQPAPRRGRRDPLAHAGCLRAGRGLQQLERGGWRRRGPRGDAALSVDHRGQRVAPALRSRAQQGWRQRRGDHRMERGRSHAHRRRVHGAADRRLTRQRSGAGERRLAHLRGPHFQRPRTGRHDHSQRRFCADRRAGCRGVGAARRHAAEPFARGTGGWTARHLHHRFSRSRHDLADGRVPERTQRGHGNDGHGWDGHHRHPHAAPRDHRPRYRHRDRPSRAYARKRRPTRSRSCTSRRSTRSSSGPSPCDRSARASGWT